MRFANVRGRFPEILLLNRFSCVSSVSFPKSSGMVPDILFRLRSRVSRFPNLAMEFGIVPVNLHFATLKPTKLEKKQNMLT